MNVMTFLYSFSWYYIYTPRLKFNLARAGITYAAQGRVELFSNVKHKCGPWSFLVSCTYLYIIHGYVVL